MKTKKILLVFLTVLMLAGLSMNVFSQSASGGRSRRGSTFQLTVTSNVSASVSIINPAIKGFNPLTGNTTFVQALAPGKYTVKVTAPNYTPQTKTVDLKANQTLNFQLQPALVSLNISSNIKGARVKVSGPASATGSIPFQKNMVLGNYSITVSAGGYISQTKSLNLTRDTNFHFELKPAMGTVQVMVAPDSLNKRDIYAREKILIIDNGIEMEGLSFQLRPGQHTLQIISGGLWTQTTIKVEAGKTYTIQPSLTFKVSESGTASIAGTVSNSSAASGNSSVMGDWLYDDGGIVGRGAGEGASFYQFRNNGKLYIHSYYYEGDTKKLVPASLYGSWKMEGSKLITVDIYNIKVVWHKNDSGWSGEIAGNRRKPILTRDY